jgi:hypothetical protein
VWALIFSYLLFTSETAPNPPTAVFVTAKKGVSKEVFYGVRDATWEASRSVLQDALVPELILSDRLGGKPEALVEACGADLSCIANIGAKVGAARVLYARAVSRPKGSEVQLLLIGVRSKAVEQRAAVDGQEVEVLRTKLRHQIHLLFGADESQETPVVVADEPPASAPLAPASENHKVSSSPRPLLYAGLAVSLSGAAALGVGIYFGASSQEVNARIVDGTTPQIRAVELNRDANTRAQIATGLFISSAVLLAAGVTLFTLDVVLPRGPKIAVSPLPGGAFGAVHATF